MKLLSLPHRAYLAGLIDGEGCIFISRTNTSASAKGCKRGFAYRSGLSVSMTGKVVLKWAKVKTDVGQICPVKKRPRHKQAWRWSVWSIEASDLLKQVLPFLVLKQQQAKLQIRFQSIMRQPGSLGLSNREWAMRKKLFYIIRKLNKRGSR